MKKIINLIIILLLMFSLFGCKKEETKLKDPEPDNVSTGSWEINYEHESFIYDNQDLINFLSTSDLNGQDDYKVVALLGNQVVAGTNHMFLCQNDNYEVVIVYEDLDSNYSISKVVPFKIEEYLENNSTYNHEMLMGGWYPYFDEKNVMDVKDIDLFNPKIVEDNFDTYYKPIALLGSQIVSGTNYCYLVYEGNSMNIQNGQLAIMSIYKDLNNSFSVNSIHYLDLREFNH